jgi:HSP20 family protein
VGRFAFVEPNEWGHLREEVRQLFDDLAANRPSSVPNLAGTCQPLCDVFETDEALELVVDACGISATALRVVVRQDVILVAGEKSPRPLPPTHSYHLLEREFGRFARAIRVAGAFDIAAARAVLRAGQLTVVLPKREERRGRPHRIPIEAAPTDAA